MLVINIYLLYLFFSAVCFLVASSAPRLNVFAFYLLSYCKYRCAFESNGFQYVIDEIKLDRKRRKATARALFWRVAPSIDKCVAIPRKYVSIIFKD